MPLIGCELEPGEKILSSNVATAVTMREAFAACGEAFMEIWGPKVTQLAGGPLETEKTEPMTITDPIRHPGRPLARPGAAQSVANTHTEQAVSSSEQPVLR